MREVHAQDGVAGLEQRRSNTAMFACAPECGCTFACSAPNNALCALDRELFDDVHELAAAVVALARIAFGVLVREDRAGGLEDGLLTKFSEAISSSPSACLAVSRAMAFATSGSVSASDRCISDRVGADEAFMETPTGEGGIRLAFQRFDRAAWSVMRRWPPRVRAR